MQVNGPGQYKTPLMLCTYQKKKKEPPRSATSFSPIVSQVMIYVMTYEHDHKSQGAIKGEKGVR